MRKWIKIQQIPKYKTFNPNIFSTAKRILKWKTHLWLINPQQEETSLRFSETLKKFHIWWRNMKICLNFTSLKVFGRFLLGLGGQLVKRDTLGLGQMRRRRLWEDGYPSPGQNVNKRIGCLSSCIKRAMKMRIFWYWVRAKQKEVTEKVSQLSNVSQVGCFVGFRFWCLLNCIPSCWHGHRWLLTGKH